jgi:N-acetylglutamate synthase-like GNAT family acetyltransferase
MNDTTVRITDRLKRILERAELEANSNLINPYHLLLACLQEKTGAFGEIYINHSIDIISLRNMAAQQTENQEQVTNDLFALPITRDVQIILDESIRYMKRYNQMHLNEGHLLKALLTAKVIDEHLSVENKKLLLTLGTTARDLITHLADYKFPHNVSELVRKVSTKDDERLLAFVEQTFSSGWSQTIKEGLSAENRTIYLAESQDGNIIGFAGFDIYKGKKNYFGPMGVSTSNRTKGIGYALLHHCLRDMKEIGYEYAIIGGAGPIEFYEKACQAVVIPIHSERLRGSYS